MCRSDKIKDVDCVCLCVSNPPTAYPFSDVLFLCPLRNAGFFCSLLTVSLWPRVNSQKHCAQCQLSWERNAVWFTSTGGGTVGQTTILMCTKSLEKPQHFLNHTSRKQWTILGYFQKGSGRRALWPKRRKWGFVSVLIRAKYTQGRIKCFKVTELLPTVRWTVWF